MNGEKDQKEFDYYLYIAKYGYPLLERKWMILYFSIGGLILSLILTFLIITPEHATIQEFLVQEPRSHKIDVHARTESVVPQKARPDYVAAEVAKLKSSLIAGEVFKILPNTVKKDLESSLAFTSQIIEGVNRWRGEEKVTDTDEVSRELEKRDKLMAEMHERILVKTKAGSVIQVIIRTIDPAMGPLLIQDLVRIWQARNLMENRKETKAEADFALQEKNKAYDKYKKAEKTMIDFRRTNGLPGELTALRDVELQLEMERIDGEIENTKNQYHVLDRIYLETRVKEAGIIGNIISLGPPLTAFSPSRFAGRYLILYGTLAGFALGIAFVLSLDYLRGPIRHENDIINTVHVPMLGSIPKLF